MCAIRVVLIGRICRKRRRDYRAHLQKQSVYIFIYTQCVWRSGRAHNKIEHQVWATIDAWRGSHLSIQAATQCHTLPHIVTMCQNKQQEVLIIGLICRGTRRDVITGAICGERVRRSGRVHNKIENHCEHSLAFYFAQHPCFNLALLHVFDARNVWTRFSKVSAIVRLYIYIHTYMYMYIYIHTWKEKLSKVASEQTFYLCLDCLQLQALICLWQDSWELSTPSHSVVLIGWILWKFEFTKVCK